MLTPPEIGRLYQLEHRAYIGDGFSAGIDKSAVLGLLIILLAARLVRFMVEYPTQSGRMITLIHPKTISGVGVVVIGSHRDLDPSMIVE